MRVDYAHLRECKLVDVHVEHERGRSYSASGCGTTLDYECTTKRGVYQCRPENLPLQVCFREELEGASSHLTKNTKAMLEALCLNEYCDTSAGHKCRWAMELALLAPTAEDVRSRATYELWFGRVWESILIVWGESADQGLDWIDSVAVAIAFMHVEGRAVRESMPLEYVPEELRELDRFLWGFQPRYSQFDAYSLLESSNLLTTAFESSPRITQVPLDVLLGRGVLPDPIQMGMTRKELLNAWPDDLTPHEEPDILRDTVILSFDRYRDGPVFVEGCFVDFHLLHERLIRVEVTCSDGPMDRRSRVEKYFDIEKSIEYRIGLFNDHEQASIRRASIEQSVSDDLYKNLRPYHYKVTRDLVYYSCADLEPDSIKMRFVFDDYSHFSFPLVQCEYR